MTHYKIIFQGSSIPPLIHLGSPLSSHPLGMTFIPFHPPWKPLLPYTFGNPLFPLILLSSLFLYPLSPSMEAPVPLSSWKAHYSFSSSWEALYLSSSQSHRSTYIHLIFTAGWKFWPPFLLLLLAFPPSTQGNWWLGRRSILPPFFPAVSSLSQVVVFLHLGL